MAIKYYSSRSRYIHSKLVWMVDRIYIFARGNDSIFLPRTLKMNYDKNLHNSISDLTDILGIRSIFVNI